MPIVARVTNSNGVIVDVPDKAALIAENLKTHAVERHRSGTHRDEMDQFSAHVNKKIKKANDSIKALRKQLGAASDNQDAGVQVTSKKLKLIESNLQSLTSRVATAAEDSSNGSLSSGSKISGLDSSIESLTRLLNVCLSDLDDIACKLTQDNLKIYDLICKAVQFGTVAASTASEKTVFVAPAQCKVSGLSLVNGAVLSIDGTNSTKLELINKGADGTGTTVLATFDQATEAFVAFDEVLKAISDVILSKGAVLSLKKSETGTGGAVTDLFVAVNYKPM